MMWWIGLAYAYIGLLLAIPLFDVKFALRLKAEIGCSDNVNIVAYILSMILLWPLKLIVWCVFDQGKAR